MKENSADPAQCAEVVARLQHLTAEILILDPGSRIPATIHDP